MSKGKKVHEVVVFFFLFSQFTYGLYEKEKEKKSSKILSEDCGMVGYRRH